MEKLNTIQKRRNLNVVYRVGEPGPGGAYHDYSVCKDLGARPDSVKIEGIAKIAFQKGARLDAEARDGVLDVDLLEIVRDRLLCFQSGEFRTRENACALTHIEEALMWMNKRVEDRKERGVLGKHEK
jgi:hypothetical protein